MSSPLARPLVFGDVDQINALRETRIILEEVMEDSREAAKDSFYCAYQQEIDKIAADKRALTRAKDL